MNAFTAVDMAACVTLLGAPGGICSADACVADDTCGEARICEGNVCVPGCRDDDGCPLSAACHAGKCMPMPCPAPCGPGQTCEHGVCQ